MNRRGFLAGLLALPFAPAAARAMRFIPVVGPRMSAATISAIIASTINRGASEIADNVSENNALLALLRARR